MAAAPHTPQEAFRTPVQYVVEHWPPTPHASPCALDPVVMHTAGGLLVRKSLQENCG
jgi:hypothetical protein